MNRFRFIGLSAALCISIAACEQQVTVDQARATVIAAQALMQQAVALQQQGNAPEAAAEALRAQNEYARARDQFLSARADLSDNPDVLVEFAQLCEHLDDHDLAGEAYLRAANLRPEDAALWFRAGRCFVVAGGRYLVRAAEPLDRAEAAVRSKPGDVFPADIEALRGDVSWKSEAYDIARTRYAAAWEIDPANTRANLGLAMVAIASGQPARAQTLLTEIQLSDKTIDPAAVIAREREAYLAYRRARPALPDDPEEYRALAGIAIRTGFVDDARAAVERMLVLKPDDVFALNMIGSLAQRDGDIERARQAFMRSLELQPDQPRTREALAALPPPAAGQGPLR